MKAKKLAVMGLLSAIALTIFTLEAQIPPVVPIPGIKLGLANIVTVFAVYMLGPWEAVMILSVRIFLGAVFAGNFSTIAYSAAGGALAIGLTILLRKVLTNKQIWISGCLSAMAHAIGQMAMAIAISGTPGLMVYLPFMLLCGMIAGLFTGICGQLLVNRGEKLWKTFLK